jgi:FKBP-type peptidyl-prolyl cis-trans isomerase 2
MHRLKAVHIFSEEHRVMTQAKAGDTVKVHYTGKLGDGTVFDTSAEREPLEFTVGEGQVIPGFEQAVVGMNPGDSRTMTIPVDEAYGPHRTEMVLTVGRDQFPGNIEPEIDQQLQIRQPDGQTFVVTVTDVNDETVTLDANNPLAGQDLTFDIQLVEIA